MKTFSISEVNLKRNCRKMKRPNRLTIVMRKGDIFFEKKEDPNLELSRIIRLNVLIIRIFDGAMGIYFVDHAAKIILPVIQPYNPSIAITRIRNSKISFLLINRLNAFIILLMTGKN